MPDRQLETLINMSESYYLPGGFHSPEHRQRVLDNAEELSSVAYSHNVDVDNNVVQLGAAWHDAGTAISPLDFEVKDGNDWRPAKHSEEVAAELFRRAAERFELPLSISRKVCDAILGTNPGIPPRSVEAKIVAAADLSGVGFDGFPEFVANTKLLWQEAQWRAGKPVDWEGFVRGSINYLGLFTGRNIRVTSEYFDTDKRSAWHVGATKNILQLAEETLGDVRVTLEIDDGNQKSLTIHIEEFDDDEVIHQMKVKVPFSGNVFSVPDESVQAVKVNARTSRRPCIAKEIERVLRGKTLLITREVDG